MFVQSLVTWIHDKFTVFRLALVIVAFPFFLLQFIVALAFDVGGSNFFPVDATHVPTFYSPRYRSVLHHISLLLLLAFSFGGIHCAGWNFSFPSYAHRTL